MIICGYNQEPYDIIGAYACDFGDEEELEEKVKYVSSEKINNKKGLGGSVNGKYS